MTRELRELLRGHRFDLALTLHEDFDGQGVYLYELQNEPPHWGERVLAAQTALPIDPRRRIDISTCRAGVIRRSFDARRHRKLGGLPEAVFLHRHHARRALTIETPSESALEHRSAAHVSMIEAAIALATH